MHCQYSFGVLVHLSVEIFFLVSFTVLFTLEYLTFCITKKYETSLNDPLYNITTKLLLIIYYYRSSIQFKIIIKKNT